MARREKLVQELAGLDDPDWFAVIGDAQRQRRAKDEKQAAKKPDPKPGVSPEQFAAWIAQRHFASDPSISEIIYLPANAPKNEIRLLEINVLLNVFHLETVEPVDFSPDVGGLEFRVLVADITSEQWEMIREQTIKLPNGWSLTKNARFSRGKSE